MVRPDGYACFYCALPVRLTGDHRHPGYGIVDHVAPAVPPIGPDGLPDLRVLHRFCNRALKSRLDNGQSGCGLILRRAWLGWATAQFEAGESEKHYGARHYERLGLHPDQLRSPRLFPKYWQVRKMRCASHACHYYAVAR
ncbi:hypothetical protein [Amycolatopsis anabasis]|uniref:hypothetical protein n=1 Tax=Amycolatopsis anabasis TaxID=1840409 RepID=UPI00131D5C34|nr:hypothetical protein [Amycolatopsis anabasis]